MSRAEDILDLVILSDDDDSEVEFVDKICSDTDATESPSETNDDNMPSPASPPFRHARRGRPSSPRWQFLEELVKDLEMETTNKIAKKQKATSST
uniref:Uncharacterized protein n=1 Tax=Ciona savignyi TaxID=51511 RepID=H2ZHR3_CIOSA